MRATLDTTLFDRLVATTDLDPRPYQGRICTNVHDLVTRKVDPFSTVMVESPTGSGKTPMGLMVARMLHETHGYNVGWVSMNVSLRTQAARENIAKNINVPDIRFISMFEKDPPRDIDVIIHDEAQHDAAASASHLHEMIRPKIILGMSATPYRTDRVKLCFEKVVKDCGIAQLIKQGYLSPYNHYAIKDWEVETVCDTFINEREKWGKSFMFFLTTVQCEAARDYLASKGFDRAEVVTGSTDRERQLDDFRAGKLEVLIGMKVISEGIDMPELKTVFVRDSQKGPTIQMSGRVFRLHPVYKALFHQRKETDEHDLDTLHAIDTEMAVYRKQIVQSDKTKWPMTRTALPIEQWLHRDGEWRSVRLNPHINKIVGANMAMMARVQLSMPKYLTDRKTKRRWRPQD